MKKTVKALFLIVCALAFGMGRNAFAALPAIDGTISPANEWANDPAYTYYLDVTDPNEPAISDNYDIKHVVLFQSFHPVMQATDGIYILIETYGTPSFVDLGPGQPVAAVSMNADFNGDGFIDLSIEHKAEFGPETLHWSRPIGSFLGPSAGADFGTEGVNFKRGSVLEYFIPSTTGGTPHLPFPSAFIGTIVYDNGGDEPDDRLTGSLSTVPEPGTFFLLGSGLLGLLGVGKFGKK